MASKFRDFSQLFPTPDNATKEILVQVYAFTLSLAYKGVTFDFYVSIVGIILTTFHLIILTRKAMRTSSIISIMTATAICDMVSMIEAILVKDFILKLQPTECSPPLALRAYYIYLIPQTLRYITIRCSIWLSVSMSLIRVLVVKFSAKRNLNISNYLYGFRVFRVFLAISTASSVFYFLKPKYEQTGEWSPAESCGDVERTLQPVYEIHTSEFFTANNSLMLRIYMFLNGTTTYIVPCLLLPFLTVLMVLEFRKVKNVHKSSVSSVSHSMSVNTKSNNERTTGLVIFMAVSFFISLLPSGIAACFQAVYTDEGFLYLSTYIDNLCHAMLNAMACLHCFICFAMSAQYRQTAKMVLGISDGNVVVQPSGFGQLDEQSAAHKPENKSRSSSVILS